MMTLHPEHILRDGKEFVLLPSAEYEALQEQLEEVLDLIALTEAKAESNKGTRIPLEEIKKQLGI